MFSLYTCRCNPFIIVLQDLLTKIFLCPLESLSLEFTLLTLSRTAVCFSFALTVKPAFCNMDKSVLPPALVLRCLQAGSGYINICAFEPYLSLMSCHISSVFDE